ncbi:O-antigen ligase family protein [Sphingorhabdus sp.]|jgi:O-antigen ligase|uniref:O-antigen ligase family protein n=1 Tax=Sphingorhabdus sp. TaxID=1902408 RepID=UPI0037CC6754
MIKKNKYQKSIYSYRGYYFYSIIAVFTATLGISSVSQLVGPLSIPYYIIASISGISAAFAIYASPDNKLIYRFALMASIIILLWFVQSIAYSSGIYEYELTDALLFYVAIIILLALCFSVVHIDDVLFSLLMKYISVGLIILTIYGLSSGQASTDSIGDDRFSGGGFRDAIWGETALGLFLAAVLSKNRYLVLLSLILGLFISLLTQVRATGLIILIGFLTYICFNMFIKRQIIVLFFILLSLVTISAFFIEAISQYLSDLFLLDNMHRGVDSGFSGRTENVSDAFYRFLESPFIGVGPLDTVASWAHNGFVKMFAQCGIILGLAFTYFILFSIVKSFKKRELELFVCCLSLLIFYLLQPRNLNFQIMPLVGLLGASRAWRYSFNSKLKSKANA